MKTESEKLIDYILKLEEMNGLLVEELNKHINYVNKHIQRVHSELQVMSEDLKDILDD